MLTRNDLSQIKAVVQETIQPEIKALKKSMATKEDMKGLETRLNGGMKGLETNMKTLEVGLKSDMKSIETRLKDDIKTFEVRLIERIDEAQMEIISTVDKHKADKDKVDNLGKRVERLEDNAGLPPYAD